MPRASNTRHASHSYAVNLLQLDELQSGVLVVAVRSALGKTTVLRRRQLAQTVQLDAVTVAQQR